MGFRNFQGIFGEFSAKKDKKITGFENIEIPDIGGSIRYDILFDIRKVSIYRHSIISRYDTKPIPGCDPSFAIRQ